MFRPIILKSKENWVKMATYDYVIWDLDGTLLDDRKRHYACYLDIVEKYGGTPVSEERYWELKRNKIKRTVLLEETAFEGTYQQYLDEWIERIEQIGYLRREKLRPGAEELLKKLHTAAEKVVLVTMRNHTERVEQQLQWLGIAGYFDAIFIGKSLQGQKKTDVVSTAIPDIAEKHVLVIGDTEDDEQVAKSLGADFVAMITGLRDKKYLGADCYADCIADVADWIGLER